MLLLYKTVCGTCNIGMDILLMVETVILLTAYCEICGTRLYKGI